MCAQQTLQAIEIVLTELTKMRRSFTGQDVHHRIHNRRIRRQGNPDFSGCTEPPGEISREVRQMFNSKHPIFKGYGSAIVYHQNGPVLFFPLPYHAKRRISKIIDKL